MKKITVIIPTMNCEKDLEECMLALKNQKFKNFDVLVVDGHSKDNTVAIAKKYGAKVIFDDGKTRASACNKALENVSTPYIAFTDADCLPPEDWLEKIIEDFEKYDVASIGGANFSPESDNDFAKCVDIVYSSRFVTGSARYGKVYNEITEVEHNPGCNSAYSIKFIKGIRFDESLPTAEDVVFDYEIRKKGGKILFDPELGMPHKRRNSLKGLWKQIYRYGLGRAIANKKYKELKSIFHILPSLAILFFPIFLIFSIIFWILFSPIFIYLLLAFILSYFLLCVYGSATSHSKYKNARRIIKSAFLIPVAHIAWGLGYLKGMR
ncbi:MAG: glycosyltransferase [Thermoplasmatales archaeon]|nr:glycosyltransferase [Thermoplasmatales archaeon]